MNRALGLIAAAALALGLWGCGKKEAAVPAAPKAGEAAKDILIGAVAPKTGEAATFGISCENGVRLAIEQANDSGGLLGRKLQLIVEDDKGDPVAGKIAFSRLIERDARLRGGRRGDEQSLPRRRRGRRGLAHADDLQFLDQPVRDARQALRLPRLFHGPVPGLRGRAHRLGHAEGPTRGGPLRLRERLQQGPGRGLQEGLHRARRRGRRVRELPGAQQRLQAAAHEDPARRAGRAVPAELLQRRGAPGEPGARDRDQGGVPRRRRMGLARAAQGRRGGRRIFLEPLLARVGFAAREGVRRRVSAALRRRARRAGLARLRGDRDPPRRHPPRAAATTGKRSATRSRRPTSRPSPAASPSTRTTTPSSPPRSWRSRTGGRCSRAG